MSRQSYKKAQNVYKERTEQILQILPDYVREYVLDAEGRLQPSSAYTYLHAIWSFLEYLLSQREGVYKSVKEIPVEYLGQLNIHDFNEYIHSVRNSCGSEKTVAKAITAITRLFDFLFRTKYIENADYLLIQKPKIRKTDHIVYLNGDEVTLLQNNVSGGYYLTDRELQAHRRTKTRDMAIVNILLCTGIRVSECAALDIEDIDTIENSVRVIRKGGKEERLFYVDFLNELLIQQIADREDQNDMGLAEDLHALFLNNKGYRLSARSIEKIVKKYASYSVVGNKRITPHKLRATYGTALYNKTGDIYLVASSLGHNNVNTTKDYYAHLDEGRKREAGTIDLYQSDGNKD